MPDSLGLLAPDQINRLVARVPASEAFPELRPDLTLLLQHSGQAAVSEQTRLLLVQSVFASADPARSLTHLLRFQDRLETPEQFWCLWQACPAGIACLVQLFAVSQFLTGILVRRPELLSWLLDGALWAPLPDRQTLAADLASLLPRDASESDVGSCLRRFTHQHLLRIGCRDVNRLAEVEEITADLSALADCVIQSALQHCQQWLEAAYGVPMYTDDSGQEQPCQFCVIGMGKLGGSELNFSSDIDLMYVYTSYQGETRGIVRDGVAQGQISNHEYFVNLARRLTNLLGGKGPDGQAFRVDLRLRPDGMQGQLALSLLSYEAYYARAGQPWEKMALLKARPVAGAAQLGDEFLAIINPFVYRRHLDYEGLRQLQGIKQDIDSQMADKQEDRTNVKLGRGGIREIEFFIQLLQLLFGGRQPHLQERHSLRALARLREADLITPGIAATLAKTYKYLRRLEHCLQIEQGAQTHTLPRNEAQQTRLARLFGHATWKAFYQEYLQRTESVHAIFKAGFFERPLL